ncbi:MAG TPA: S24 family peptidase [Methylotenera sp.]|nr:S24 family peptidase [Methylotenera sp.]
MGNFDNDREKNLEWLGKLRDYFAEFQSLPSYRYMQDLLGIRSKEKIGNFISLLKDEGFLDLAPDKKIIPTDRFFEVTLSDTTVQAGTMTQMMGDGGTTVNLQRVLIKKPSVTEIITVRGNSMIDEHIADGDKVIVEKRPLANVGDIVVAILNDEQTVKTLGKENGEYVLIPANKNFQTIRNKKFEIFGVVKGLYRIY